MAGQSGIGGVARAAGRRFWALPWKYKGPAMGLVAVMLLGAASGGGEEEKPVTSAFVDTSQADSTAAATSATSEATAKPTETPQPPTVTPEPSTEAPAPTETPLPTEAPPPPTATQAPLGLAGGASSCTVSAVVSDSAPTKNTTVYVTGTLSCPEGSPAGATMSTTWAYKSTTSGCESVADANGVATCSRSIGGASAGFEVRISVLFRLDGQSYRTSTSFTPR